MSKEEVIDKIKKLLSKTEENGATPAEAAAAVAMAQRLMAKHGVEVSQLDEEEETEVIEEGVDVGTKSTSSIQCWFAQKLAKHFACRVIKRWNSSKHGWQLAFIGESVNCKAFVQVYKFAYNAYKFNWEKYHKSLNLRSDQKVRVRGTYIRGFVDGVTNELIKSENQYAIVLVEHPKVQEYMDSLHLLKSRGSLSLGERGSMQDYMQGYRDGSYSQAKKRSIQDAN